MVRGPASVLYSAKAIGGIINIITRQGSEQPFELELSSTWHSASNGRQATLAASGSYQAFNYRLTASGEEHHNRTVADGPYSSGSKLAGTSFDNQDLQLHLGYQLNPNHQLSFKANRHQLSTESWTDPAILTGSIEEFSINLPKRDLHKYGLYYDGSPQTKWIKRIQANSYYQWIDREFSNHVKVDPGIITVEVDSTSSDRNINYGGNVQVDFNLHPQHQFITGLHYLMDDLDTLKTTRQEVDGQLDVQGSGKRFHRATMQTLSLFMLDTWQLNPDLKLHAGVRYYHVQTDLEDTNNAPTSSLDNRQGRAVSSLGLTYHGWSLSTLRLLYSEGYIMPTLLQMYTDSSAGRGATTYGNPQLDPERSKNIELGIRYANHGWLLDSAAFYTQAQDYITSHRCDPITLCPQAATNDEYIYINANQATSFGLELQAEYQLHSFSPYLSATWMRRQVTQDNFRSYHSDIPLLTGKAGVRYQHFFNRGELWLDAFVRSASESSYQESATEPVDILPGYSTLNFSLGGALGSQNHYQWALHLNNLLDKSYRASSDELPGTGRSVIASVQARF